MLASPLRQTTLEDAFCNLKGMDMSLSVDKALEESPHYEGRAPVSEGQNYKRAGTQEPV